MDSGFTEANLYVYNGLRGLYYDAVIWCLGPVVDGEGDFGIARHYLAWLTIRYCRLTMQLPD